MSITRLETETLFTGTVHALIKERQTKDCRQESQASFLQSDKTTPGASFEADRDCITATSNRWVRFTAGSF